VSGMPVGRDRDLFFAPDQRRRHRVHLHSAGRHDRRLGGVAILVPAGVLRLCAADRIAVRLAFIFHGGPLFSVLGVLSLFLLGVNLAYSRNFHRTVREAVALRFENTGLIEQLQQEKERAESASRSKSQFLAAASHDLRQPTHALGLYIATLRAMCNATAVSTQEVGAIAGKLQVALKGLVQLLDVLLDISKLDAGAVKVRREVFDVQELLETIDQQFPASLPNKNCALSSARPRY